MSTPNARPRRSKANLHPADILLQDKQTRRSSVDVAQEKADLQARRKALLEKREADLRELALLEEQMELQEKDDGRIGSAHPPAQPQAGKKNPLPRAAKPAKTAPQSVVAGAGKGRGAVEDEQAMPPPSVTNKVPPASPAKKSASGRIKRATRLDVEAYRHKVVTPPAATPQTPARTGQTTSKRKVDVVEVDGDENTGVVLEDIRPKKGRMTKPGGVTAAAAAKFAVPAQSPTVSSAQIESSPATRTIPSAGSTAPSGGTSERVPNALPVPPVSVKYGGYVVDNDEDNTSQLRPNPAVEHAPGSVTKGTVKVEFADMATVTSGTQASATGSAARARLPTPGSRRSGVASAHWSMAHVEQILGAFTGNFAASFVPKLINATGNAASGPWKLHGFDLQAAMRNIANEVWPDIALEIVPRQPFFEVAKQKLSEYRNGVANEAIEVVSTYLLSSRFATTEARATYVAWALDEELGFPFRYAQVWEDEAGILRKSGAYQGSLVMRTFAYHIRRINVRAEQIRDWPCNALALATTAVERALQMWATGSLKRPRGHSEEAKFSDRLWGRTAGGYLNSIIDLTEFQWDGVLNKADRIAQGLDPESGTESDSDGDSSDDIVMSCGRATIDDYAQIEHEESLKMPMDTAEH